MSKKNDDKNNHSTFWKSNLLPIFIDIFNDCKDSLVSDEILSELESKTKELEAKNNEYNENFNPFIFFVSKFCLFLSVLALFIPWYWSYKWYKKLKLKKESLLKSIEESKNNKLMSQRELVSKIDYLKFFNNFNSIIKYQNMGPLTETLIDTLKKLSIKDITSSKNTNFYNSSWGIYDNNKIVVHKSKQVFLEYMKTYSGSTTVYTTRTDSNGRSYTEAHVVTATYDHIAYTINHYKTSYAFMESCSSLEFNLDSVNTSKRNNRKFDKSNKEYSPLENTKFEDNFNWHRNNETQFRMFFTPLAQENYVNEYYGAENDGDEKSYLEWRKINSFVFNEHESYLYRLVWFGIFEKNIIEFVNNHRMSFEEFLDNLFLSVIKYYFDIYKSIPYMFLTSIMTSEDHKNIIKDVQNKRNKKMSPTDQMMMFHNILNERFGKKIIVGDTDCFNELVNVVEIAKASNNNPLYKGELKGTTFIINKLIEYVYALGPNGMVSVPVPYDDYIKKDATLYAFSGYINDDYIYSKQDKSGLYTDIKNNEILDLISEIEQNNIIVVIKNKILSAFTYDSNEDNYDSLITLFKKLNN